MSNCSSLSKNAILVRGKSFTAINIKIYQHDIPQQLNTGGWHCNYRPCPWQFQWLISSLGTSVWFPCRFPGVEVMVWGRWCHVLLRFSAEMRKVLGALKLDFFQTHFFSIDTCLFAGESKDESFKLSGWCLGHHLVQPIGVGIFSWETESLHHKSNLATVISVVECWSKEG